MKKIAILTLVLLLVFALAACNDMGGTQSESTAPESTAPASTSSENTTESTTPESTTPENPTPEITLQEVYDAGKNLAALLGSHESVYVQVISNGTVIREEYLDQQYCYSFYSSEFMDIGFDYASLTTDHSQYDCFDGSYSAIITLTPSGTVDLETVFAATATSSFISSEMLDDDAPSVIEKDGLITVTCTADAEEIVTMGEDVVSCVETYTLDAKTREMTAVKTVYTYKDGSVEEGVVTITRDVNTPEGMNAFLAYEQETENLRQITIVSNPGTENEITETIQVPNGLTVVLSPDWYVEKFFMMYSDAACTQPLDVLPDTDTDMTVYILWDE